MLEIGGLPMMAETVGAGVHSRVEGDEQRRCPTAETITADLSRCSSEAEGRSEAEAEGHQMVFPV